MTLTDDDKAILAWRNLVVQWHLNQELPLNCGCDDDTPDDGLCAPSVAYAERMYASRPDSSLDGDTDPWSLKSWTAAWGRNAPLIASAAEFRLPVGPAGMNWLVTRILVRGRCAVELALMKRTGDQPPVTVSRVRVDAEPSTVAARARRMLDDAVDTT